jgi:ABC-2 type transport system permease protein
VSGAAVAGHAGAGPAGVAPVRGTGHLQLAPCFRLALHAEWTKLRTLSSTTWTLAATAVLTIAVGTAASAAYRCAPGFCSLAATGADPAKITLTGLYIGQVLVAVLGVLVVGGEYGSGMIRVTLSAMPRRLHVLAAKAAVFTGVVLVAALAGVLGSMAAGRLLLPGRGLSAANGYAVLSLGSRTDLRAFGGSVLYLALIGLLALGITAAVRDSGAAIGIVLGLLFLFPIVTSVMPDHVLARHLEQASPMIAGMYIEATAGLQSLPLTPWQGLGVLALWALAALLLGGLALRLRDA